MIKELNLFENNQKKDKEDVIKFDQFLDWNLNWLPCNKLLSDFEEVREIKDNDVQENSYGKDYRIFIAQNKYESPVIYGMKKVNKNE